jgi:PAS domain S-box-containing protein
MKTGVDCTALVAAAADAVIVADAAGRITLWNAAAERIFGYTEDEALGQSLDVITPERFRQRHWDGYAKTMETGVTKYGTTLLKVPAAHKDGRSLSIAFTVALIFTPERKVDAIIAIVRDETARFAEERELRKRIVELEKQLGAARSG